MKQRAFHNLPGIFWFFDYEGHFRKQPVLIAISENVPVRRFASQALIYQPLVVHGAALGCS
jgi:hypothetical protein